MKNAGTIFAEKRVGVPTRRTLCAQRRTTPDSKPDSYLAHNIMFLQQLQAFFYDTE